MALVLLHEWLIKQDASETYVFDSTQDYIDAADGGWSTTEGGSIDRDMRTVLCFATFTDEDGVVTYLLQYDQYLGSDQSFAVAPGAGLADTDKSMFTILTPKDGHHTFYTLPIEYLASDPVGVANLVYHNSGDGFVYIYYNSAWVLLTEALLPNIHSNAGITESEALMDIRSTQKLGKKLATNIDFDMINIDLNMKIWTPIWDFELRKDVSHMAFADNKKSVARDALKTLESKL